MELLDPRWVSGLNQFDLRLLHCSELYEPKAESWQTLASGTVETNLPLTVLFKVSHSEVEGQHASPGKQRHGRG